MLPAAAPAALSLRIGPFDSPATPDAGYDLSGSNGPQFFDVVFEDTDPADNEGLFAYDLVLRMVPPASVPPGGTVRFLGAERPAQNFVLDVSSGATFTVAENTPGSLLINVSSNNDLANIDAGDVAARIFYTVDPGGPIGDYTIVFDTQSTVFGSGDPNRPLEVPVTLTDAGYIRVVPEPSCLTLLGGTALLALRRRRKLGRPMNRPHSPPIETR